MRDVKIQSAELSARDEIAATAAVIRAEISTGMVERVARAIANQSTGDLDPRWLRKATAGIFVMMEPTDAMVDAGYDVLDRAGARKIHSGLKSAYVAMLRKALWP